MKTPIRFGRAAGALGALALGALAIQSCGSKESLIEVSLTATPADTTLTDVSILAAGATKSFTLPSGGLSDAPVIVGVYVPSSATGDLIVDAQGRSGSSTGCYEGIGHAMIASAGATVTVPITLMPKKSCAAQTGAAGSSSPGTGGAAGTGAAGTQGAAGAAGTGAAGAAGTGAAGAAGTGAAGAAGTGAAGAAGTGAAGAAGTGAAGAAGTGTAGTGTAGTGQVVGPPSLAKCTEYSHIDALSCTSTSTNGGDTHVWDVAFSPNGSLLVTAGDDSRAKIWKMTGGVPTPEGHVLATSDQAYVAFSPDGKYLVEGSTFGEYKVYDASTFALLGNLSGHDGDIEGVAFTPDSKSVWAIDYDFGVLTRHEIGSGSAPSASVTTRGFGFTLAVSPVWTATAQYLAVGYDDGTADIANTAIQNMTPTPITVAAMGSVYALSFSSDGATLAAGADDGTLAFWTIPPPASAAPMPPAISVPNGIGAPLPVRAVKYSPDGKTLAVGAGSLSDVWKLATYDAATRKVKNTKVPTFEPISVAWSPNGAIIVAGETNCGKFIICAD
jgi:hypothetical protein